MIERHVTFNVLPGREAEFEELFNREYAPAMSMQPGFRGVALLRRSDPPGPPYEMIIRFDSPEEAAAWRASDAHRALSPRVKALHAGSEVTVYEVVAAVAPQSPAT